MPIIIFLIIIAILIAIELRIYSKYGLSRMDVDVHFSQEIANHGQEIEIVERASNNKRLPLPFIIFKFEVPNAIKFNDNTEIVFTDNYYREDMLTMSSFSRHTRRIKVTCSRRGFYPFTRITVSSSDLLLIRKLTTDYPTSSTITILPKIVSTDELKSLLTVTLSEQTTRRTLLTDPFSFAGIREYQPWDPMRTINWTASAKSSDFMVNQTTSASNRKIHLFLNLDYYNTKKSTTLLERSIELAYSLLIELEKEDVITSFYSNGKDKLTDSPIISTVSFNSAHAYDRGIQLARIDLTKESYPFSSMNSEILLSNPNDLNIIISANSNQQFQDELRDIDTNGCDYVWVRPCFKGERSVIEINPELSARTIPFEVSGHD